MLKYNTASVRKNHYTNSIKGLFEQHMVRKLIRYNLRGHFHDLSDQKFAGKHNEVIVKVSEAIRIGLLELNVKAE